MIHDVYINVYHIICNKKCIYIYIVLYIYIFLKIPWTWNCWFSATGWRHAKSSSSASSLGPKPTPYQCRVWMGKGDWIMDDINTISFTFQFSSPKIFGYGHIQTNHKSKKLILRNVRRILHQSLATSLVVKISVEVLLQGAQQESRLWGCVGSRFEWVMF